MTNRNKIKQWFITFPQWRESSRSLILETFTKKYELSYYKIAEETHKDGNMHYHALIVLQQGETKVNILKYLSKQYPADGDRIHIRAVRSLNGSVQYLSKEDKECLEHPDGYKTRTRCLQKKYLATLLMWANFLGYETIEDYELYLIQKLKNACVSQ